MFLYGLEITTILILSCHFRNEDIVQKRLNIRERYILLLLRTMFGSAEAPQFYQVHILDKAV